jgi:hypothetical protein
LADEDKLVKAGVEAALKPFADLLDKLAGPAAKELGLALKDHMRVFRLKRQLRLFERVKEMLAESNMQPGQVPFKLLLPLVENASVEENDNLQDRWAAMLANAAVNREVHPSFPEILKQLSEKEVAYLDACFEYLEAKRHVDEDMKTPAAKRVEQYKELDEAFVFKLAVCLNISMYPPNKLRTLSKYALPKSGLQDNVIRLGLMRAAVDDDLNHKLTDFGRGFVKACRPPSHKGHIARSTSSSE